MVITFQKYSGSPFQVSETWGMHERDDNCIQIPVGRSEG